MAKEILQGYDSSDRLLEIGDKCMYVRLYANSGCSLEMGQIVGFTPKKVRIQTTRGDTVLKFDYHVVRIDYTKPADLARILTKQD